MRVWRLRPGGEFERVRQSGHSWSHHLLVIIMQPRVAAPTDPPRVAVVAGRRLGGAVVRNRIKRKLREAVRQVYPNITPGLDLIILARAPIIDERVPNIASALTEVLQHAEVWRDSSAETNAV
jgi:ribonuclease P protein component